MNDAEEHLMTVFSAALEIGPAAERRAYLDRACADDPALRERVEALLRAHERAGGFLGRTSGPAETRGPEASMITGSAAGPAAGTVIAGRYKLLERIGEGGMGEVWMAEQTEPIRRRVALKMIKPGMDTRAVLARFEAERQALALMDHPSIARVLEAGATPDGRPYFVMELVKGTPITEYCDGHRLGVQERLGLFAQVCEAVQHAHQKGVIHRDLKPSNVLVAPYDGVPVPKVIDFGIAKATGQALTERSLYTGVGTVVGTPEYMSPEQAELNNADIDTRSDIYSLGVLLYELLTGTTPLTRKRLKEAALLEVLRLVREEEPPRPSTRLTATDELPSIAAVRGVDPVRLPRLIRGELDWIVMRALEKDRNRRYASATGLAADIRRHLADEPVLACPPSVWYRFRKFARRSRSALVMAAIVLVAAIGLAASLGWAARDRSLRRALVRERAIQAIDEARDHQDHGRWPDALAAARRAEALIATGPADDDLRSRVRERLADARFVLDIERARLASTDGYYDLEQENRGYERAFRGYGIDVDALDPDDAAARIRASAVRNELTSILLAWSGVREQLREHQPQKYGTLDRARLLTISQYADPNPWRDRLRRALVKYDRKALTELAADEAEIPAQPVYTLDRLGDALLTCGAYREAEAFLRKAQHLHPDDFWITNNLADAAGWEQPEVRMRYLTAAVALRPRNLAARVNLGILLENQGRLSEAGAQYREGIRFREGDPDLHVALGRVLQRMGQREEAATEFRRALQLKPDHPTAQRHLDSAIGAKGSPSTSAVGKAMVTGLKTSPDDPVVAEQSKAIELDPRDAGAWIARGDAYGRLGRHEKAFADYSKAIELGRTNARAWKLRGDASLFGKHPEEAIGDYSKAIELDPMLASAWNGRGLAYGQLGRHELAIAGLSKAIELDPGNLTHWHNRGVAFSRMGQHEKALADFSRANELLPGSNLLEMGKECLALRRPDAALVNFSKAVERTPKAGLLWYWRGIAHRRLHHHEQALADYRQALSLIGVESQKAPVYDALAGLLTLSPDPRLRDLADAVKLAEKAVETWPANGKFWSALGAARYRSGDAKAALTALERALKWRDGNAVDFFLLAMAHARLDHPDEARSWYGKALAWQDGFEKKPSPDEFLTEQVRSFRSEAEDVLGLNRK